MNEILNREKYREIDRLLDDEYVMLQIDPEFEGVDIPQHLRDSSSVTLQLSRLFRGSMELDDLKIEANLLFSGNYYCCKIPYEAIWAAASAGGEEKLWPSSIPEALAKQLEETSKKLKFAQPKEISKKEGTDKDTTSSDKKKKRPTLRLVKG